MADLLALADATVATGEQGEAPVASTIRDFGMKCARAATRRRFDIKMGLTRPGKHSQ